MTFKILLPILLATLATQPAFAADDDHAEETVETHDHDDHEDHEDHEEHDDHEDREDHAHSEDDEGSEHVSTMGEVRLLHGWTRATEADTALIFVEVVNEGENSVTLTGGRSDLAETASLVGFTLTDGDPSYVDLLALPVAPGTEMMLAPQGVALRLDGLSRDLAEGDSFEVTISFADNDVVLTVEVEAADATQHSHAGHAH